MIAKQHLANYSSCEPLSSHFSNLEQLLNIDWIKNYTNYNDFFRFSLCKDEDGLSLMAEMNKGQDWWVICDLIGVTEKLNLPKFDHE
jgi:hypothetical protein